MMEKNTFRLPQFIGQLISANGQFKHNKHLFGIDC
jgi:hypothetical protein